MGVSLLALAYTVVVISLFSLLFFLVSPAKKPLPLRGDGRQLPPAPPGLPLLGHRHLLGSLPHRSLRSLAASHGPVMLLRLGRKPTVVVSSAAAAEEAMTTRDLAFANRPKALMAERLLYDCDMGFAPYGEYWRQARRICSVHLLSPRRILSFRRVREQGVAALIDRVRGEARARPAAAVNLSDMLISYSNGVISRATFGDEVYRLHGDTGGETLRRVVADFAELIVAHPAAEVAPWLRWVDVLTGLEAKTKRTFEALDGLLERVIADHRKRRPVGGSPLDGRDDQRDFLDVLLDVNEMDMEASIQLDTVKIKAFLLDLFIAGTDTTYTVLEWAMAELVNWPDKMRRLQDEIRAAVAGANGQHATEDLLDGMPYLRAVVTETLRLHTPAPLLSPRETTQDTELLGYRIPRGTRVLFNAWAIGRDPATWERCEEFAPERFLEHPVDYRKGGSDFRFLPFGAGRRGCPGAGFASPTMELALANMLYHFDWELPHDKRGVVGDQAQLLDMSEVNGLSVRLKVPLLLVPKPWPCSQI